MGLVAWDLGAENLPSPPGFKDLLNHQQEYPPLWFSFFIL